MMCEKASLKSTSLIELFLNLFIRLMKSKGVANCSAIFLSTDSLYWRTSSGLVLEIWNNRIPILNKLSSLTV